MRLTPAKTTLNSGLKSELQLALTDLEKRVEKRITEEEETTRRHFHVRVDRVEPAVKLVAEGHSKLGLRRTTSAEGYGGQEGGNYKIGT